MSSDPIPNHPRPGLAVALGSSFLGVYAHSGFLNGLLAGGVVPARIAGSSAGALAGALFSCGLRGDDLRRAALDPRLRLSFADIGALWRLPGVLSSLWASGIFSGRRTVGHLRALLGERDLDGLALDVAVTNLDSSRTEILTSGPLAEAVMASCAVPALFTIQTLGGKPYLDGGIACELPFEHLLDDPAIDTILLHRIRHQEGSGPNVNWRTVANAIGGAHHTVCNELHELRRDLARAKGKRLIEIDTLTPFPGLFGKRLTAECHELGFRSGSSAAASL